MSIENFEIDAIDRKIIDILRKDAAFTTNEIAKTVDLSPSATHERIKKLHAEGIIKKVAAFINAAAIEQTLCAFIFVLIDTPQHSKKFLEETLKHGAIMECHHITGEYSYILKVRVKNIKQLEALITDILKTKTGIVRTLTHIVLSSPKDGDTIID